MSRWTLSTRSLPVEQRYDWPGLMRFLAPRAIPGVEEVAGDSYRRTVRSAAGCGVLTVRRGEREIRLEATDLDGAELDDARRRVERLLGLETDLADVARVLGADPALAPLVTARPQLPAPGAFDGWELAVRAIVGQQVTVAAATTLTGRVVRALGRPLDAPLGTLGYGFPSAAELARAELPGIGMPGSRVATLRALGAAVAAGHIVLDGSADPEATRQALLVLPGIGPWTAGYVAMRALADRDAFPVGDVGLRRAAQALGLPSTPRELAARAERWRPYRTYAVYHLWASLGAVSGG